MEQDAKAARPGRRPGISPATVLIMALVYLIIGAWVGRILAQRTWRAAPIKTDPVLAYRQWYYAHQETTFENTYWRGIHTDKCPLDVWVYQEIIYETKPDVLVETGTAAGGSAFYFASIFDLLQRGRVLTVDIVKVPGRPENPRITYLLGSSTSDAIVQTIKNSIRPGERVMVSLDSDHHKAHVLEELRLYSPMVTVGNYLVVEDTVPDINYLAARDALEDFLRTTSDFVPDKSREKYGFTVFPGGWLKRVR